MPIRSDKPHLNIIAGTKDSPQCLNARLLGFTIAALAKGRDAMMSLFCNYLFLGIALIQQGSETDFDDLGKILLCGVIVAIASAIAFTFVRLRLRDKKPPTSTFISINPSAEKK